MSTMTQDLLAQLDGAPLQQISRQLGIDQSQASTAVGAALPLLMGALGRNASEPQGAEALFGALQKDHAGGGGIGHTLGAVLGGAQTPQTDAAGVLGHIFGGQQARAEQSLGAATGLGGDRAGQLMKILAPIVMAYLAKRMFSGNAGSGGNPTADLLGAMLRVGSSGSGLEELVDVDTGRGQRLVDLAHALDIVVAVVADVLQSPSLDGIPDLAAIEAILPGHT